MGNPWTSSTRRSGVPAVGRVTVVVPQAPKSSVTASTSFARALGGSPEAIGVGTDDRPGVLSISELYGQVDRALADVFPRGRQLWVRGEIHSIADQTGRTGHCYIDLVEPDASGDRQAPVLRVKCWRGTWGPLRSLLAGQGIELQVGMTVILRGSLDFYRPRAEIGFILDEIDVTSLLGRLAAQRAALIKALGQEGLLERNRSLPLPAVPLRIGLVASPGTEGYRDFLGQLEGSGFAFDVVVSPTPVQGAGAPAGIAHALALLVDDPERALDLVVVVRGGGSKADLAAFDTEAVARSIAMSPLPVWTGIGHTGDESVADLVAQRSCITPTACGREIVVHVAGWWETSVGSATRRINGLARECVGGATERLSGARARIGATARLMVDQQLDQLLRHADRVVGAAERVMVEADTAMRTMALQVVPQVIRHMDREASNVVAWRRLLEAYDVERQLARGYTLTFDERGQTVRSISQLAAGSILVTRVVDGVARSIVTSVTSSGGVPAGIPDNGGNGRKGAA